jgi:hypothetical protein
VPGRSGYPGDFQHFGQVKEGLHRLAELRTSHRREGLLVREAAE